MTDQRLSAVTVETLHYLTAIRTRMETLYALSVNDPRLREQISDEVDWINAQIEQTGIPAQQMTPSVSQHIGWLKQYVEGMTADNWQDMRLRAERQLIELATAFAQRMPWQPIETGPKDGSLCLVWAKESGSGEAWCARGGKWHWVSGDPVISQLTHWMPLPEGPAVSSPERAIPQGD